MVRTTLVRPAYSSAIYGKIFGEEDNARREIRPPLGLMALAGYLRHHDKECVVLDGEPELWSVDETCSRVLATNPTHVGVTSTTPEWPYALQIVRRLKKVRPETKIILGGPHVTNLPHQSLREADHAVDWVVLYEGEAALLAIVEGRAESVAWAASDDPRLLLAPTRLSGEELSSFVPSREVVDMSKYKYVDTDVGLVANDAVESARGCPFGCAFCTSRRTKLAIRSVASVIDEIVTSARNYNTKLFMFFDDTFTINRARTIEIFSEILAKKRQGIIGKEVKFYGFTRANTIDFELMKLLKEAGADKVTIGVETGDENILLQMEKGTKLTDYVQAYRILDELRITKRASFIVGHPFETENTVRKSIDFALSLNLDEVGVNIMTPFPG
jgi:anaerobic magnesium-protoporphyrin IX monomethyl ester cyclase